MFLDIGERNFTRSKNSGFLLIFVRPQPPQLSFELRLDFSSSTTTPTGVLGVPFPTNTGMVLARIELVAIFRKIRS